MIPPIAGSRHACRSAAVRTSGDPARYRCRSNTDSSYTGSAERSFQGAACGNGLDRSISGYTSLTRLVDFIYTPFLLFLIVKSIPQSQKKLEFLSSAFMAVGAYASAYLTVYHAQSWEHALSGIVGATVAHALIFLLAILVGALVAALAGLVVGIPSLRLRGDYLAIVTLGFAEIIRIVILNIDIGSRAKQGSNRACSSCECCSVERRPSFLIFLIQEFWRRF